MWKQASVSASENNATETAILSLSLVKAVLEYIQVQFQDFCQHRLEFDKALWDCKKIQTSNKENNEKCGQKQKRSR